MKPAGCFVLAILIEVIHGLPTSCKAPTGSCFTPSHRSSLQKTLPRISKKSSARNEVEYSYHADLCTVRLGVETEAGEDAKKEGCPEALSIARVERRNVFKTVGTHGLGAF